MGFTHLHLHTQYSLLDGAIRVKDLFPKVKELGMDTVAVTDHGNMFGAIDLYTEAKAAGVKLIFGCETYVAATDRHDRTNRRNYRPAARPNEARGRLRLPHLGLQGRLGIEGIVLGNTTSATIPSASSSAWRRWWSQFRARRPRP